MKLLIATGIYPPDIGGPATYSKIVHDELIKQGHSVRVVSFGRVRSFPKIIRHIFYFLLLFVQSIGVDKIYAQDPVSVGLPAFIVSKILRKPFIVKIVGDYAWEQGVLRFQVEDVLDVFLKKENKYHPFVMLLKKIEYFVASRADKIIVPSAYLKNVVSKWGVSSENIFVIYNSFISTDDVVKKEEEYKKKDTEEIIILSAGRLVPWKGFYELISFIPDLVSYNENIRLIIAGDGPIKDHLIEQVNEKLLHKYVRIVGKLTKQDLYEHILRASVFVLNTKYEGLSHQLLEVMSLKTPIITTDIGGNPELITNNVSGVLVYPDDKEAFTLAIKKIISDDVFRKQITEKAFLKTKEFTKEKMITHLIKELV